jgi:AcrR family transcriptional regulator
MSDMSILERPATDPEESAKRRQILLGARNIFLTRGFDAASMADIAKAAEVSKGTLYVYFKSKEELFSAIAQQECATQAEVAFRLDENDHDVAAVLTRLGIQYVTFVTNPHKASSVRIVIAIAERMPEIGKAFYQAGPACGISRLKAYLDAQVRSAILAIDDTEVAAAQFIESCHATLFKPVLFNSSSPPSEKQIRHVVDMAVRVFMAAYQTQSSAIHE